MFTFCVMCFLPSVVHYLNVCEDFVISDAYNARAIRYILIHWEFFQKNCHSVICFCQLKVKYLQLTF